MESILHNENVKKSLKVCIVSGIVILGIKYLLPLFWPFVLAYFIGEFVCICGKFLNKKLQFNYKVAIAFSLVVTIIVVGFVMTIVIQKLFIQIQSFILNWPDFQIDLDTRLQTMCGQFEETFRLSDGLVYETICDWMGEIFNLAKKNIFTKIMTNSPTVVVVSVEIIAAIIVAVMGGYFYATGREEIRNYLQKIPFNREILEIKNKLSIVFKAFIRAQVIIMIVTIVICSLGFAIIKNPYFLILGIVVGLLDALPLIGLGIILIPWAIVYFLLGNVRKGLVIFIVYMLCYFAREILEPKLIGANIGMNPLVSLVCIYVGYKIFGLLGVFLGPVAYLIIVQLIDID